MKELSNSDKEILQRVSEGKTAKEIATETGIKVRTIEKRLERLKKKTGCRTKVQLVVQYLNL